jgi:mRNA interferase MazF
VAYVPEKGDVIWIDFRPTKGHEQSGHRPALVMTPKAYNAKTNLVLVCPITSRVKGYPFEVSIKFQNTAGVVLADQIKSIDWVARKVSFAGAGLSSAVAKAEQLLLALLG